MVGKRFCPQCGSEDVEMVDSGDGASFMCQECGYSGKSFPEHQLMIGDDLGEESELIEEVKPKKTKVKKIINKKAKRSKK